MNTIDPGKVRIVNTIPDDLTFIYWLFEEAIRYQKKNGYPAWKGYDKNALRSEMDRGLQYKVQRDAEILAMFSISYTDPATWGEWDTGKALYLHRCITNPHFKGQRTFENIRSWAIQFAKDKGLDFLRIDTWTDNPTIIEFYGNYGFTVVAHRTTPDSPELPEQNRNLRVTLMEMKVP